MTDGGCAVTGYTAFLEDVESPGFTQVYNGETQSAITRLALSFPIIKASKYYKVRVHSVNCSLKSAGEIIIVTSGSEPGKPAQAPFVFSYDSTTAMMLKWSAPSTSGGFPITSMKLYVDGSELVELNQSQNFF